jgi:hypothetical protein
MMTEAKFKEAIRLIRTYSLEQILQTKQTLLILMGEMNLEKKNLSNEVRRAVIHFQLSNRLKAKRIQYIDDVVLPRENENLESQVNVIFPNSKITTLSRLKQFRKERARLLKTTNDHTLRVKQNARLLVKIYAEIKKLEEQYALLNETELVRQFVTRNNLPIDGIIDDHVNRLYRLFQQQGGA